MVTDFTGSPYRRLAQQLSNSTSSGIAQDWLGGLETESGGLRGANLMLNLPPTVPPPAISPGGFRVERTERGQPVGGSGVPSEIPAESATFLAYLGGASAELSEARLEARDRVGRVFNVSIALGIIGGFALLVGIGVALGNLVPIGTATAVGGAVSSFFSVVFWRLYQQEDGNLQDLLRDLRHIEKVRLGLGMANQITDKEVRDRLIESLAVSLSELEEGGADSNG